MYISLIKKHSYQAHISNMAIKKMQAFLICKRKFPVNNRNRMFIKISKSCLYFKNCSAYKNLPISSPKITKGRKTSSNSLAISVTSGKKIVLFMKPYSMLCLSLLHMSTR